MTWFEILEAAVKKTFALISWVLLWVLYVVLRSIELLLHELNGSMNKYLFDKQKNSDGKA